MKNGATYFKWSVVLMGIIVVFLLFRRCGNTGGNTITVRDTVTKVDTFWKEVIADSEYILHETVIYKDREKVLHDTLEITEYIKPDTARILRQYFATRTYRDTLRPKGLNGYILIYDTVTQNRIVKRGLKERFSIPEVVTTNTITVTKPQRITLYAGFQAGGTKETPLYSTGINLGIMAKNGKYYGLSGNLTKDGNPFYEARIMFPIRLKKR